ncbi:Hypothetical predicted protein [Mytilus galloprovincialis]|uniref:Uncharacterized protein n=1 Tax=Mytilus galloprovincialis TaxID=29158 RepID=A0A8B6HE12_MYTGA|nr:Hypothetical predicted protein [Mytilus galloprovincialis]
MGGEKDIQKNEDPTKDGKKKAKGHKRLFAVSPENVPNTNLLLACLVTLCFNPILGPIAAYYSLTAAKSYSDGDKRDGERRALISVIISLVSIVFTVVLVMTLILVFTVYTETRH